MQKTDTMVQIEAGPKVNYAINVVVEPGSTSTERTVTESSSAVSSPTTEMPNVRMLALDNVSQASSCGMDFVMEPSFTASSNDYSPELSIKVLSKTGLTLPRCDSHDSGMA